VRFACLAAASLSAFDCAAVDDLGGEGLEDEVEAAVCGEAAAGVVVGGTAEIAGAVDVGEAADVADAAEADVAAGDDACGPAHALAVIVRQNAGREQRMQVPRGPPSRIAAVQALADEASMKLA
jgi:hypothetical protein